MIRLLIGISLIVLGGVGAIFVTQRSKGWFFLTGISVAQFFILPIAFSVLTSGQTQSMRWHFSGPIGDASIVVDGLSAFFLLIISFGGMLAAVYSIGYMKMYQENSRYSLSSYYFFMGLLVTAMMFVVVVQNVLLFLIVWEIMSLASFFLVSFENGKEEVHRAAIYYFIAMQVGVAFLIIGFSWAALRVGTMDFSAFGQLAQFDKTAASIIFLLLFIGFGTKAGFIPMHSWLPLAHPAAPSGVSAMMSGIMIKTGIYGILRLLLLIGIPAPWLAYTVFGIGLSAGILGVMNAIAQHDLKRLLAFHSIENIGIIGIGIGLGMIGMVTGNPVIAALGYLGAILHVFNHFTFKSLLFYGAGVVYVKTHTRDIEKLGGLVHSMPYTAGLFLLGSLAITGLPLLNGFISEFALYSGMVNGMAVDNLMINLVMLFGMIGLSFIGVMAMICFTKVFGIVFQGSSRSQWNPEPTEASALFLIPMFALAGLILLTGLGAPIVLPLLNHTIHLFVPDAHSLAIISSIYLKLSKALWIFAGLILFFVAMRWLALRGKTVTIFKTWDCGYQAESSRLQYTASSFASSFLDLVSEIVQLKKHLSRPQELFPLSAHYESHSDDALERWLIRPLLGSLKKFLMLFSWVQSGRTQQYILYGLIFLIIIIVWIIGVR
ncbi:MAG: proton-conducting transporter membrane subunit [Candidatus Zhuqueibacterota bacterium]